MLNNSFKELVIKYERYRNEQRRKKAMILFSLLAVIGIGFWFVFNSKFITKSFQMTTPEVAATTTPAAESPAPTTIAQTEESNFDANTTALTVSQPAVEEKAVERIKVEVPKTEELPTTLQKREPSKEKSVEKSPFKLEVTERKSLYNLLVKHKDENSFDSSLNVTQFYFDEKDYENAVTWAVKTSKLNPKDERPWLIYAKSKAAQGKKEIASKALKIYLNHTQSKKAQEFLETLK